MPQEQTTPLNQAFIQEIQETTAEIHFDRMTRLLYSTDASIYQMMPIGVAIPHNQDEIIAIVEIAARHSIPLLPRGGGSSLAGQAVGMCLILDLSRFMDRIVEINPHEHYVRTQPGITLSALNRALQPHGLIYGPDPASAERATMGGILGNNSTGAHSILYGMTVDHVLSTDVVLADGSTVSFEPTDRKTWEERSKRSSLEGKIYRGLSTILKRYADEIATRYPKTFRHVAGYNLNQLVNPIESNLAKLMVGSEGTLGIISEMHLNLVPLPKKKRLAMVHFSESRAALETVPAILETQPSAIEVLDKMLLDLTRDRLEYKRLLTFIEGDPTMVLLVEYAGEDEGELDASIQRLKTVLGLCLHSDSLVIISDPAEQTKVWHVRKVGLGILMSIRGDAKPIPFIEDAAVPVEYLADYVTQITDFASQVGVERVAMYAHASAGCIHIRPLINLKSKKGLRQLRQIAERSVQLVTKYGGSTSGEHGEGIARGEFSEQLFGPELVQAFREVKRIFDPHGLLNPGKIVDVAKMDDPAFLRIGPNYETPFAFGETIFSFAQDSGFTGAVEMCNGAGVCRQLDQGVMCPSFQVTRSEADSTRGRANALREAMKGSLGFDGITSKELYEVLDLCLSCHACKSECPSAVDMAKLKAEFLYHYNQKHGIPLRSRIFGNVGRLNQLLQPLAPLINGLSPGPGKWFLRKLGVHPDRAFPHLSHTTFSAKFQEHRQKRDQRNKNGQKKVVFFHDTFTEYSHPKIGEACIQLLEAGGYEPIVLTERVCCGRPAVSKGLLEEAKDLAEVNIKLLAPFAQDGVPIIGCEPSCMAMLVNEYQDLLPGEDAKSIAAQTQMIDTFLLNEIKNGGLNLPFANGVPHVLFHGHCQQKAIFGTTSTNELLSLIPNCVVEEIESGCCGMAGSFGYERVHYELSIKLAEMNLAPAVRNAPPDAIICAAGTSCRDQIEHTTGRQALHPMEVLAEVLFGNGTQI